MARAKQPRQIRQMTFVQWEKAFPNEEACRAYVVGFRWPKGVACPRCGNTEVKPHGTMPWNWLCNECSPSVTNYRFSHITGTIFEKTNKPLRDWFRVLHLMLTSKKGISARQIHRMLGFGSYETAWYMCHRIRAGLRDKGFCKLMGIVEVDETFVGGLAKNRHRDKRGGGEGGTGGSGKMIVARPVRRKGNVVARVIADVRATTLETFVREAVSHKVSLLCTDKWVGYKHSGREFPHGIVDHSAGQYVCGSIHTG